MNLSQYKNEAGQELYNILHYWMKYMVDDMNGGFYGRIDGNNRLHPQSPKGSVLNARILWAFSAAYNRLKIPAHLGIARLAFDYITKHFIDKIHGGVYWTVDYKGGSPDKRKQIYALAFTIYACAEYYQCSGDEHARKTAINLYHLIQANSYDTVNGGYFEAFSHDWKITDDWRLSKKDVNEKKTLNTHLHILEAYTTLYRIYPDPCLGFNIRRLLQNFSDHFIDHVTGHLNLFFDEQWNKKSDLVSFGHEIEASWLVSEAAEVLEDPDLIAANKESALFIAAAVAKAIDTDGGLWYEYEPADNKMIREKHWWPQAEAMIGFFNAWQISGDEAYYNLSAGAWNFVNRYLLDKIHGEWWWGVKEDHSIIKEEDKAGLWKCPYHNSRACLEIMKRIENTGLV